MYIYILYINQYTKKAHTSKIEHFAFDFVMPSIHVELYFDLQ